MTGAGEPWGQPGGARSLGTVVLYTAVQALFAQKYVYLFRTDLDLDL